MSWVGLNTSNGAVRALCYVGGAPIIAEWATEKTVVLKKNKWLGGHKIELGGPQWEGLRGAGKIAEGSIHP